MLSRSRPYILPALAFISLTIAKGEAVPLLEPQCERPVAGAVLTLQAAADRLRRCNAALLEAQDDLAAAQADLITADHAPNPTLGMSLSNINPKVGVGSGPLIHRTVDSGLRIDELVERGGKRTARRHAALAGTLAAGLTLHDTELRSGQSLLEAYVTAAAAAQSVELLNQAAASYRESAAAMDRRLAAGDVARIEVDRTALDAGRAAADAQAAQTVLTQARADLAALLGAGPLPPDTRLLTLAELASRRGSPPADRVPTAQLIHDRADVQAAAARVDAAEGALAAAKAARVRDVDVSLGFDHWPVSAADPQGTGDSFTIGASIPLQWFDSGRGAVGHAFADLHSAQTEWLRTQTDAESEMRTARETLSRADALAARYREDWVPGANRILAAQERAYRRGGASLLDLLDARRNARQVSLAAVAAERDAQVAAGRLALALGSDPLALFLREDGLVEH